jgi:hypothetical protein
MNSNICSINAGPGFNPPTTHTNNLTDTNPLFVNPISGDFHLSPSSPAINAGVALSEVPTDFEGTSRPQGSSYDIGADEYGIGGGSTPTPIPSSTGALGSQYTASSQIPSGFAVPWDVANPSSMLVSANCSGSTVVLKAGNPTTTKTLYVYKTAYTAVSGASSWTPVDLFGSSLISGAWYKTQAQGVTTI